MIRAAAARSTASMWASRTADGRAGGAAAPGVSTVLEVATIDPSTTPNPDAMKFTLDVTLPGMLNASRPDEAPDSPFVAAVLSIDGVASVFGVNDFVTITREPGADWEPIIDAVRTAAAEHL